MPSHDLELVRQLASDEANCEFFDAVMAELRARELDSDDLLYVLQFELGETHWFKSRVTEKYHPGTVSDYYSVWIDFCDCRMFVKLLIREEASGSKKLVITSFKKDNRYE